jgi:hypothetical protein
MPGLDKIERLVHMILEGLTQMVMVVGHGGGVGEIHA